MSFCEEKYCCIAQTSGVSISRSESSSFEKNAAKHKKQWKFLSPEQKGQIKSIDADAH